MLKKHRKNWTLLAAACAFSVSGTLSAATLYVSPDNTHGWHSIFQTGAASVEISDIMPRGRGGSLEFDQPNDGDFIGAGKLFLTESLADLTAISYDYVAAADTQMAIMRIDYFTLAPYTFGTLIWAPQAGSGWTTTPDGLSEIWMRSGGTGGGSKTLAEWQADPDLVGAQIRYIYVGGDNNNASLSYADLVRVQFVDELEDTVYDFTASGDIGSVPTAYHSLAPCRISDSRSATNPAYQGPLMLNVPLELSAKDPAQIVEQGGAADGCNVPPEATALVLNVTAVAADGEGSLVAYPAGDDLPSGSLLNFANNNIANSSIVPICEGTDCTNDIAVTAKTLSGTANVIVDVSGYFAAVPE